MTKRIKLTKAKVDLLDHEKDGQWVTDTEVPQLVVRLTPTAKTYVARWTSQTDGKRRQTVIDRTDALSVSEARNRARKLVSDDRPKLAETLGDVFDIWEKHYASTVSVGHAEEIKRTWVKHIAPDLANVKLSRLSNARLQEWYNGKRADNSAATVKRWIAYISKFCTIARQRELMTGNPVEGLEMSAPNRRLDIFTKQDIKDLGDNLTGASNKYPIGVALIRFLMMFPCRGIEAREMRWADLDLEAGTWTIPASRYKTGADKVFPLGPLQVEHLGSLPRWSDTYVFPRPSITGVGSSRKTYEGPDVPVTKNHQIHVWKQVRPKPLGAHALRKTIGHLMLNKDVPLEVVSKLMGHSSTLVTQQVYAHLEPQKAAQHLDVWSAILEDDAPKSEPSFVDDVLKAHASIKMDEYNKAMERDKREQPE
jgi:integrase